MAGQKHGLLGSTAIYGVANVIQHAAPLVVLPILTRYLTPTAFGKVAVFLAMRGLVTPLVGINVTYAVRRRYFAADKHAFSIYLANCVGILCVATALLCAAALLLQGPLVLLTGLGITWIIAAILFAAAEVFIGLPLTVWQVEHRSGVYTAVQSARAILTAVLMVGLVIATPLNWRGAILGMLVATILIFIGCLPTIKARVSLQRDHKALRHALRYGGGLIPHTLGTMAIAGADRLFVNHYVGPAETGLYWVGYQISFIVIIAADAFNRAWSPWLYRSLNQSDDALNRQIIRFIYRFFGGLICVTGLTILIAYPIVTHLLAEAYGGADRFVGWIAAAFALSGMARVTSGFIFYAERTLTMSLITSVVAALNIALNALLVPRYGAMGAAQSTLVVFAISFGLTWYAAQRARPMPWRCCFNR